MKLILHSPLFGLCLFGYAVKAGAVVLQVAPQGSDAQSGTQAQPFATLERARDEIRAIKKKDGLPKGGIVVEVLGGRYQLARPVELTAEDSGTAEAPILYRARPGDEARISGGHILKGWQPDGLRASWPVQHPVHSLQSGSVKGGP